MKIANAMLDAGMCKSKSDANRLMKQGTVSMRFVDDSRWLPLDEEGMELLEPFPDFYLKVGNGNWRCVQDGEKGKPLFSQYRGIALIPGIMVDGKYVQEIRLSEVGDD